MSTKSKVIAALERSKGEFISGGELASQLGVSRNSVWKAIKQLGEEGYAVESVTGKGYRLANDCNILSAASIQHYLQTPGVEVEFHEVIDSTNIRAKAQVEAGAPAPLLVVADRQTAGKGRQGRAFYSPSGSGVYFSLAVRPQFALSELGLVTGFVADMCAQAMDDTFGVHTQIKWVNDIFCNGRKVCGILTEASITPEAGSVAYVVIGIGVNVAAPKDGWPDAVAGVSGALVEGDANSGDGRARLVARTVDLILQNWDSIADCGYLEDYRSRSLLTGRSVHVEAGREQFQATVLGINDDFTLQVQLGDGTQRSLSYGEVHIPSSQL